MPLQLVIGKSIKCQIQERLQERFVSFNVLLRLLSLLLPLPVCPCFLLLLLLLPLQLPPRAGRLPVILQGCLHSAGASTSNTPCLRRAACGTVIACTLIRGPTPTPMHGIHQEAPVPRAERPWRLPRHTASKDGLAGRLSGGRLEVQPDVLAHGSRGRLPLRPLAKLARALARTVRPGLRHSLLPLADLDRVPLRLRLLSKGILQHAQLRPLSKVPLLHTRLLAWGTPLTRSPHGPPRIPCSCLEAPQGAVNAAAAAGQRALA